MSVYSLLRGVRPSTLLLVQALLCLGLTLLFACSPRDDDSLSRAEDEIKRPNISGMLPERDLNEMVQVSDAVIVGTVEDDLGTWEYPVGPPGDESRYLFRYRNLSIDVARFLYPPSLPPQEVAIGTTARKVLFGDEELVWEPDVAPEFRVGETVLLFLEHLPEDAYATEGFSMPETFSRKTYYVVIMSRDYGKLVMDGNQWVDTRSISGKRLELSEVERAIRQVKASQRSSEADSQK